jgi:hypothetical protein
MMMFRIMNMICDFSGSISFEIKVMQIV